ncbi:MAG: YaaA family protein [Sphaerochaetaceae bacterium]|nr:YaaA family protein [Sphaerochaetaceae bacterium]
MKIIISPAKEQLAQPYNFNPTNPIFQNKAEALVSSLKKCNKDKIEKAFKCSSDIAQNVFNSYQNFNKEVHPALFFFNGLQYKNIQVQTLKEDEIQFLIENLYIADSLYGILRASDNISHYRLDYKVKVPFFDYNYYKKELDEFIKEPIINLCSKEYSKNLNQDKLFTINFVQDVKGKVKSYSTHTKMIRGKFIKYLAQNKSTSLSVIRKFNIDDYYLIDENNKEMTFKKIF